MYRVALVYKVDKVKNNDTDSGKLILYTDIDEYENITPALKTCEFYNSVYNYPLSYGKTIPRYVYVTSTKSGSPTVSQYPQVCLGYVVYDTRKPLYKVVGLLNASNIGVTPQPIYDPSVWYNSVPYEVARMAVDYYNDNEPYRDTPELTIFKYDYFPMNHY